MTLEELQNVALPIAKKNFARFRLNRMEDGAVDIVVPKGIAHLHSEVSEIYEEYRKIVNPNEMARLLITGTATAEYEVMLKLARQGVKPIGFASEFADVFINAAELSAWCGVDITKAVELKLAHYATREPNHGKAR